MTPDLTTALWDTLQRTWLQHGLLILLMGIVPAEFFRRVQPQTRTVTALFRVSSGAVVLLCLMSAPLAYDTYQVESGSTQAVIEDSCTAKLSGNPRVVVVKCAESTYALPTPQATGVGAGVLYRLAASGAPAHFKSNKLQGNETLTEQP